jgi:hypothetical protein
MSLVEGSQAVMGASGSCPEVKRRVPDTNNHDRVISVMRQALGTRVMLTASKSVTFNLSELKAEMQLIIGLND